MRYREFGDASMKVSEIGFGCSRIGGMFTQGDSSDPVAVLRQAAEAGITFFDTADIYSQGESEALLGRAFEGRRDQVVIATKGGYALPGQRRLLAKVKPLLRPLLRILPITRESLPSAIVGALSQDFSGAHLTRALEGSLRRLRSEYVDVYQLHSPPKSLIDQGDWLETLAGFQRQGKVRAFGIAADSVDDAQSWVSLQQMSSLQFPLGLLDLEGLDSVLSVDRRTTGVITRGCFGGGLLKETLTSAELQQLTPKWKRIEAFREQAKLSGRSIFEMALQFSLRAPHAAVTLLGMRTEQQLVDNLRHYASEPLSTEEFDAILRN